MSEALDVLPAGQLALPGADFSMEGWAEVQGVQEAKRAGTYSLVRLQRDGAKYEQAARLLLQGAPVAAVSQLTGWCWRAVSAIRTFEMGRMSDLKEGVARGLIETAMLCKERFDQAVERDEVEPRDLGIVMGISLQRATELTMGGGAESGGQKAPRGVTAEDLKRFLDQHLAQLPSCKPEDAPIDSASVQNAREDSGLCGSTGPTDGVSGGTEGVDCAAAPGGPAVQVDVPKGGAGGGVFSPAPRSPDGFGS